MSQRSNDNRRQRPRSNSIPERGPPIWQELRTQLVVNPPDDEDSPFLSTQRPHTDMPPFPFPRPILRNDDPPAGQVVAALDSAQSIRRRLAVSNGSVGAVPTPMPRGPEGSYPQPRSLEEQDSPYVSVDSARHAWRNIMSASADQDLQDMLSRSYDSERQFNIERREMADRNAGSSSAEGSAPRAVASPHIDPALNQTRQLEEEVEFLAQLQRRNNMPPARIEHYTSLPTTTEDSHCPICLEAYDDSEHCAIRLGNRAYDHVFGRSCIQQWVNSRMPNAHMCPSCRRSIRSALVEAETGRRLPSQQGQLSTVAERTIQTIDLRNTIRDSLLSGAHHEARHNTRRQNQNTLDRAPRQAGPSSPPPAPTQYRTIRYPPQQDRITPLSTQERLARIQRNIARIQRDTAAMTSDRSISASAQGARPRTTPERTIAQGQFDQAIQGLDRQAAHAQATQRVLSYHEQQIERQVEVEETGGEILVRLTRRSDNSRSG